MEDNLIFTVQLTPDEVEYLLKLASMEDTPSPVDSSDVSDALVILLKNLKQGGVGVDD